MLRLKPLEKFNIVRDDIEFEFEVAEKGGYVVAVPELPGCLSEGDTFEQAWEMIQDAMQGWLEVATMHGDYVPTKFQRLLGSGSQSVSLPSRLPAIRPRQMVRALEKAGFHVDHQTGSYLILSQPETHRTVSIPSHNRICAGP